MIPEILSIFAASLPATMKSATSLSRNSTETPKAEAMERMVTDLYESKNCKVTKINI